mgnify:FL=1
MFITKSFCLFSVTRYFIAQDAEEVRRVTVFCKSCHDQVKTVNLITKCKCVILKEENELKIKCRPYQNQSLNIFH